MSDDALLWFARLALLVAAPVWAVHPAGARRGRGPWSRPWWSPAVLLASAALTDDPIGDLVNPALWRDGAPEFLGR